MLHLVWNIRLYILITYFYQNVTTNIVKEGLGDLVKVLIDYNLSPKEEKSNIDTGKWNLIHQSKKINDSSVPAGFNLLCTGQKILVNSETDF